jgi:chorismate mutase
VIFYFNNVTRCVQNVTKTSSLKVTICFILHKDSLRDISLLTHVSLEELPYLKSDV